jgi:hypothetical protein
MSDEQRAEAEEQCREQLASIVLIELLVENGDQSFSVSDFSQPEDGVPRDSWQVAWAEAFLAVDGNSLLVERWKEPPKTGAFRVAFFMHFWDETKPLLTSYGELTRPSVSEMPERLKRLVVLEWAFQHREELLENRTRAEPKEDLHKDHANGRLNHEVTARYCFYFDYCRSRGGSREIRAYFRTK